MRKKILLFHESNKFSNIFLNYVKENCFEIIDIYMSNDKEIIKNMKFDVFLIQEKYEDSFENILDTRKYILSENWSYEENIVKNRIYKYTPVKEILAIILMERKLYDEFSVVVLTSYCGGVGKSEILDAIASENILSKNKVAIISFDFFEKFKRGSKNNFLDQLIYYIYQKKRIPEKFIDEMREGIYKHGLARYVFSGNPRDFKNLDENHISEIIRYFQRYIKPDYLMIEWPNLLLPNSHELLETADKIFFTVDYNCKNYFDKFRDYYFSEYMYSKAKTIFLMNKWRDAREDKNNMFYIPYFEKEKRSEEIRKCMSKILKNQLMI